MYTSNVSPANLVLSALVVLFKDDIPGPVSTTIPCLRPELVEGFTLANALYITQGAIIPPCKKTFVWLSLHWEVKVGLFWTVFKRWETCWQLKILTAARESLLVKLIKTGGRHQLLHVKNLPSLHFITFLGLNCQGLYLHKSLGF